MLSLHFRAVIKFFVNQKVINKVPSKKHQKVVGWFAVSASSKVTVEQGGIGFDEKFFLALYQKLLQLCYNAHSLSINEDAYTHRSSLNHVSPT